MIGWDNIRFDTAGDCGPHPSQIDRLIYELYGLTEEEIGIVEGRAGVN